MLQALAHFPNSKFAKVASRRKKTIQEYDTGCGVLPLNAWVALLALRPKPKRAPVPLCLAQHHWRNRVLLPTAAAAAAGVLSGAVATR